jgi:hypothetical protein
MLAASKLVVAVVIVLSCVVSALALVPRAFTQASGSAPNEPSTVPVAPDTSRATVVGSIDFSPSVFNIHSAGKYVTVRLALPEGYSVSSVYIPSLRFMGIVYAETCFSDHETGADKENSPHMVIKFLRADVAAVLDTGIAEPVFVIGMLVDGTPLYASGTLTVAA